MTYSNRRISPSDIYTAYWNGELSRKEAENYLQPHITDWATRMIISLKLDNYDRQTRLHTSLAQIGVFLEQQTE